MRLEEEQLKQKKMIETSKYLRFNKGKPYILSV